MASERARLDTKAPIQMWPVITNNRTMIVGSWREGGGAFAVNGDTRVASTDHNINTNLYDVQIN